MSNIKGIEQGRAAYAFDCVDKKGKTIAKANAYKSYIKKIPMLIKTNGLGATFAFILSKSSKEEGKKGYAYKLIYDQTAEWFQKNQNQHFNLAVKTDFSAQIINLDSAPYRAATNETIALFNWLRRFAEGLIEGEDDDNDQ